MDFRLQLPTEIEHNVLAALSEDIGGGDLSALMVPRNKTSRGVVVSREDAILCGTGWFDACFRRLDPAAKIEWSAEDGDLITAGQTLCKISADTRALLTAERSALNFIQTLSGTATTARFFVSAVANTRARIVDTRKTLPGLRLAQKYAVHCGGGTNHRMGLYDGILIKENHILAAGGIGAALGQAHQLAQNKVPVIIEVENLEELAEALDHGAKFILLDNMSLEEMRLAVGLTAGRAQLEASGGVNLDTVRAVAETGVDRISIGALTKDIRSVDLSLRHVES